MRGGLKKKTKKRKECNFSLKLKKKKVFISHSFLKDKKFTFA